ncbi:MAG: hypothetical protein WBE72_21455 [Terracidiphilus sp.]
MRSPLLLLSFGLPIALASGCGGSSGGTSKYLNLTGNWNIALTPSNPMQIGPLLGGYITNTNSSVSGTLLLQVPACSASLVSMPATSPVSVPIAGTLAADGNIAFTGTSSDGLTLSVNGVVTYPSAPVPGIYYPLDGAYAISGGCTASESGSVIGLAVLPLATTYTGTLQSASGSSYGASLTVAESGPNSQGVYTLSGAATFTGNPCFSSGAITSSVVFGDNVDVTISLNNNSSLEFTAFAPPVPPNSLLTSILYNVSGGACAGDAGSGYLTGRG